MFGRRKEKKKKASFDAGPFTPEDFTARKFFVTPDAGLRAERCVCEGGAMALSFSFSFSLAEERVGSRS